MKYLSTYLFVLVLLSNLFAQSDLQNMDLEDLMGMKIVTASKRTEKLSEAPASVIVISAQDIKERGYVDVVEILSDLPGIDMAVTRGDLYYKAYWRGFRKGISSPFLFMIDGMIMNHLYYNWTDIAAAVSLSHIKRIEFLYGPASTLYGPNAFMGVVNIITSELDSSGSETRIKMTKGTEGLFVGDVAYLLKKGDFKFNFSGIYYDRDLDKDAVNNYEYTKPKYLNNRHLWGDFVDHPAIGNLSNPHRNRSFTTSLKYKNSEIGFQYFRVSTGWSINYAFDRIPPDVIWEEPDYVAYFRDTRSLANNLKSNTLLRYRYGGVSTESNSLEAVSDYGEERKITYGIWQTINRSWELYQDFDYNLNENLSLKFGIKYEHKDLQKAYDINYGDTISPQMLDMVDYNYPDPPDEVFQNRNRIVWINQGIFSQLKYNLSEILNFERNQFLNFGVRYDHNSEYGSNTTLRGGFVGGWTNLGVKLLYGESYHEPSPRQLYGRWSAYSSTPQLKPESSQNIELVVNPIFSKFSLVINPYYIIIDNSINSIQGIPKNIGRRNIYGMDLHLKYAFALTTQFDAKLWSYYSYLKTEEDKFDNEGNSAGKGIIGDMSNHKFYLGWTLEWNDKISATIKSKYIGERKTFDTNPIAKVDSYLLSDLNIIYKDFLVNNIDLECKINNIFDKKYFHPGIRDADAGATPGYWQEGRWYGSHGWNNSLLPLPGREIAISVVLNLNNR